MKMRLTREESESVELKRRAKDVQKMRKRRAKDVKKMAFKSRVFTMRFHAKVLSLGWQGVNWLRIGRDQDGSSPLRVVS